MKQARIAFLVLLLTPGLAFATPEFVSTLIGGSLNDGASYAVRDAAGNIYVVGGTASTDFPVTPGVAGPVYHGGAADLFVAKLTPDLSTLLAATYVGGSGDEGAPTLVIDPAGNLFVAGRTLSTDIPGTSSGYQPSKAAKEDLFVVKLDPGLTTVLAATYLGGNDTESWYPLAMAIDSAGNPVLACRSISSDFPTTPGAYDTSHNDYDAPKDHGDVVVAKLDNTLTTLIASTFVGGALWDEPRALHVDVDGSILVGGDTHNSTSFGVFYPTTPGAYAGCPNTHTTREIFVSRLSPDLSTLMASTCLGRSGTHDMLYGLTTAPDGSVVLVGRTYSSTFPVTGGAYDTTLSGTEDMYVAKLDYGLSTLLASTFVGGAQDEVPARVLVGPTGVIHVTGSTGSTDFPTTVDGFDPLPNGLRDGFHVRLGADLTTLEYGTFVGGLDDDWTNAPFAHGSNLYVVGSSKSSDYPTSTGAYDETHNGGNDGYIMRLGRLDGSAVPIDSPRARWIMGVVLLALVSFAAWRLR